MGVLQLYMDLAIVYDVENYTASCLLVAVVTIIHLGVLFIIRHHKIPCISRAGGRCIVAKELI